MSPPDPNAQRVTLQQWSSDSTAGFVGRFGVMPGRWLQLENELGTEAAIRHLLSASWPESAWVPVLTHLWEAGCLHWSAEAAALNHDLLFTPAERAEARRRLQQFGYKT